MLESAPRYECRVWGENLEDIKRLLATFGAHDRTTESEELYLISRPTDRYNAKICASLLDVKRLVAETRGLQHWQPILKTAFPLDAQACAACIGCLGGGTFDPGNSDGSESEFRDELAAARLIVPLQVAKRREIFALDGCIAEFAIVSVPSLQAVPRHTVAIEAAEDVTTLRLGAKLDLLERPNRSYVQELRRLTRQAND